MFTIVTDTSANLDSEWLQSRQVAVVAFSYHTDGQKFSCTDTRAFDSHAYYDAMRGGRRVTTSQVTPQQYIDCMAPLLAGGADILFVGMSSGISGSYASAEAAKKQLSEQFPQRKLRLVDTLGASLGEGLLVMKAAEMRDAGRTLDETADALLALRFSMCQVFTVEDLKHLRATGRLSNVKALVGSLLKIMPLLKGDGEGKIVSFALLHGRRRAVQAMAERYNALVEKPQEQTVGIAHADCPDDAQLLIRLLNEKRPPKEILTVDYEPVTGAHVGPGALALFFFGKDGARERI